MKRLVLVIALTVLGMPMAGKATPRNLQVCLLAPKHETCSFITTRAGRLTYAFEGAVQVTAGAGTLTRRTCVHGTEAGNMFSPYLASDELVSFRGLTSQTVGVFMMSVSGSIFGAGTGSPGPC